MQDTKVLLQQSRERLVITYAHLVFFEASATHDVSTRSRVSADLHKHDTNKYNIKIMSARKDGSARFHVGEPIRVSWQAPVSHSRSDWIGIYRVSISLYPSSN